MLHPKQKRLLLLSGLGGVLEFYDFIIYALLAGYIAKNFFPTDQPATSLMIVFATFAIGYLVRPLGGILFGHYGDRFGRKKTFAISIFIMATATLGVALVPSYADIGLAAPIIVTALRVLQGLSIGGEIPGAIAYVSESIPERKGLACGLVFGCLISGIVLGSFVQAIITSVLSENQMQSWGWRIPFVLGGLFGFASYYFRRDLQESPLFQAIEHRIEKYPIKAVITQQWRHALAGIFITALGASIISALFLFTPSYFNKVLHLNGPQYLWYNTVALLVTAVLCLFFGKRCDTRHQKKSIRWLVAWTLVLVYPIFFTYQHYPQFCLIGLLVSAILTGFAWGIIPSLLSDLFPTHLRYSGIAFSYNLGFAIFGGLTPLLCMVLIQKTQMVTAPAFYLMLVALAAFFALVLVSVTPEKHSQG